MGDIARPDHEHDRVETREVFRQRIVACEQEGRGHNQHNALERLADTGERRAGNGHR
ncbi:hypothetical protein D3C72_2539340 [compost metagenome]